MRIHGLGSRPVLPQQPETLFECHMRYRPQPQAL